MGKEKKATKKTLMRVRAARSLVSTDGSSYIVIPKGTPGTCYGCLSNKARGKYARDDDRARDQDARLHVVWDVALVNEVDEELAKGVTRDWEDQDIYPDDVWFDGLLTEP